MDLTQKKSIILYFFFILIAVLGILWGNYWVDPYPFLRVWDWTSIIILLIALPFLPLQRPAEIPEFWERNLPTRSKIWTPVLIGIGFGILDVIIIKGILHPQPYSELPPFLQPFPYSLFLYFSGALEIELFYRLIPIVLVLYIFSRIKNGNYQNQAFWIIAILTAIREPLEQLPGGEWWFVTYALISGFAMNFLQAIYFKQAGFIATLSLRLGHYLIWHILLGIYVEAWELSRF
ncbi:hypothetical protein [Algoriphagus litoralis]|uniref:hypothetical protein n=1 Tax=Algoriphagus litoralis TaxID=2202829 RepID=UPI000DB90AEA|nr:hypothetical protein [Algoriphagus litoralis]